MQPPNVAECQEGSGQRFQVEARWTASRIVLLLMLVDCSSSHHGDWMTPELFPIVTFLPGNGAGAEWRRFDGRPMFGFLAGTGTDVKLTRLDVACPMFGFLAATGTDVKLTRFDVVCPMFGFLAGTGADAALLIFADVLPMFGFLAGAGTGAELAMFEVVPPTTGADPDGVVDCLPGIEAGGPKHWKCFCTTASFSAGDLSASHQTLFLIASADRMRQTGHVMICCLHLAMQSKQKVWSQCVRIPKYLSISFSFS